MPQKQSQKVKGCRKCSRSKKKSEGKMSLISQFIKNQISAEEYFKKTSQTLKR